jgi:hypothetical protein
MSNLYLTAPVSAQTIQAHSDWVDASRAASGVKRPDPSDYTRQARLARHGSHFENIRALFRPICKNPALRKAELGRIAIALMSWSQTLHANRLSRARWTPRKGRCGRPANNREMPLRVSLQCSINWSALLCLR